MKKITEKIVTIKDKGAELEREIREKTLGYIITSFGLVAGLAWNDAIKAFIERFFAEPGDGLKAKFLYATIVTVAVVAISLYLARIFKVEKKKKGDEIVKEVITTTSTEKK
ncbi:MAG: hypothetical protein US57_C0011G0063 [Candidatus Moranbacteria bacterium GW2011_GWC2_37_73]|nr:MAG: putative membrane protein [Parcubacteria group bacterium GW2011_GWC1_36_108]KKQ00507.1 MAG: hypothetical protein US09_C0011G0065 [Candidatus Moranbacteria bacterium GW2011_GWD1_36_198]KKQ30101.1 MAG: hypothetical protein US47_C0006G0003 [Candidatus Moranbacteria bacterium GW2011_GWE1_37_24]KKQ39575.1 MAG: hypothetical protein US57_C0011G0063 [Candidatus Moranbacteria bacterium GW2011_GWC2_37_73]